MRFVYPYLLFLLFLVPLTAALYAFVFNRAKAARNKFADPSLFERLSSANRYGALIKAALNLTALFFLILSVARPQFGARLVEVSQQGADVVIAVDVSKSMLAQDIKPDRLSKAKDSLSALIQTLAGNRVGIIAFAGSAFWQCPLTLDMSGANLFLQIMDANLIPLGGTSIGDAVRLATNGLTKTSPRSKALILLTDGEDHKSDPEQAAREAASAGIRIYTIGFGSPAGEPIPLMDTQGNFSGYKKDKKGDVVMTKLDEQLLAKISAETGGEYFRAPDGNFDLSGLIDRVNNLEKQRISSRLNRTMEDRYQYFLFLAFLAFASALFIPETKKVVIHE